MKRANLTRRGLLGASLGAGALWLPPLVCRALAEDGEGVRLGVARPFGFDRLIEDARQLARAPYRTPEVRQREVHDQIGYDRHNQIVYRPSHTLWGEEAGPPVRLFHPGRLFAEPVSISVVEGDQAREILYSPDYFDMPADHPARNLEDPGFVGFRVMYPDQSRDWLAFLGASYFRSAGPFDQFGLSARGIAVNTASEGDEEFPRFSAIWLERAGNSEVVIYALLEGPSLTGAYRLVSRLDSGVVQDVDARLFLRADIARLGVAPLTSMFWYGSHNRDQATDWRPQIHDSEGLEMWTGTGERIWRPLGNPPRVVTNMFIDTNPRGFGLMQRDRNFENYQDDGVFYERRPSLWVEPLGKWGDGSVQLVEIPTDDEIYDNIVAFWVPREEAIAGREYALRYRLHWSDKSPAPPPGAWVVATRTGMGGVPGQERPEGVTKFVVDFDGPALAGLDRESGVTAEVEVSGGEAHEIKAYPVVSTSRWRAIFDLVPQSSDAIDMRLRLVHNGHALGERWVFQYFSGANRA
jgi:periplasmic glucans biosynthesis protein